ncbi:MAG: acyl carrier protein [Planctomycetota bacterium]|nr:MAG: acyl carrier protein [Planctomycetota bacterium]
MATITREEIFDKVREILVEALSVDEDEVTEDATLTGDLGAESIDFLDIVFRLEKAFGIKIPQEELMNREILSNPDYVTDRKLNAAGLEALKKSMPHADLSEFEKDPDIDKIVDVFTVKTIVNFVQDKLAAAG